MVVIISCHHFPDDERIYHKQIKSLLRDGHRVLYYTRSSSNLNLSDGAIAHINLSINFGISVFIDKVLNSIKSTRNIHQIQIHEVELLPIIKKMKICVCIQIDYCKTASQTNSNTSSYSPFVCPCHIGKT